ncbi:MAG: protein kinase [Kofleriaceae bacterium]
MRIGRYELERPLARGGMAELYVAKLDEDGFARRVAIKQALPELARDPGFAAMFRAEARLAASLAHHNIVAVHDLGADYLVMELLHGADVGAILRASPGPIPFPIIIAIASDACAGLHHAHERFGSDGVPLGIVHRDVSPQNLFVTFDGCTKLLDFGIAKAIDKLGDRATRTGTLRGKVPYMSPEQCRGERLDRRTDVFSLGIVLWELVTGERLYGALGESDFEVFKQIAERDAPDPTPKRPDLPPQLAAIIQRALARDREARYPTIAALHDELDQLPRATPREIGTYVAALFPVRAHAWKRGTLEEVPAGPRVTAPLPAQSPDTTDLRKQFDGPTQAEDIVMPRATGSAPAEPFAAGEDFDVPSTRRTPNAASITRVPTIPPASKARWKVPVAVIAIAAAIGGAYVIGSHRDSTATAAPTKGTKLDPPTTIAPQPAVDAQWFQPDDYILSEEPFTTGRLHYLTIGKLIGPAPAAPGASAHFVNAAGKDFETTTYWQTRAATPADLTVGVVAFCHVPPNNQLGSVPTSREDSRNAQWSVARVTDIAGLPATASVGDAVCPLGAIRVPR